MFGSNFDANFGIPTFPQGVDAQGGYLGPNAPIGGQAPMSPNAAPSPGQPASNPGAAPAPGPAATPPLGQPSPLAGGPLSPGGGQPQTPPSTPEIGGSAPAAGIGSPFGRPPNG
jgi:hypothetical protein